MGEPGQGGPPFRRVGILGAGRAGTALARALARIPRITGGPAPEVVLASTRSPAAMRLHLTLYAPEARAAWARDVAEGADLVVVAVPQEELDEVDPSRLAGPETAAVVDMTNRWAEEPIPAWLEPGPGRAATSTQRLAAHWRAGGLQVPVLKAFSEVSHHELDVAGRAEPPLAPLAVGSEPAEDDDAATVRQTTARVAELIRAMGFLPVSYSPLGTSRLLEPGQPGFEDTLDAAELTAALTAAGATVES